jgi:CAAX protease family protein
VGEAGDVATQLTSAIALIGIFAFFSLWVHRAKGNRALTMGLYIVFGALAWFFLLYGLGSNYRDYRSGHRFFHIDTTFYILSGLTSAVVLLPPTRKLLARIIPFDPSSMPDMVGLIVMFMAGSFGLVSAFLQPDTKDAPTYFGLGIQALLTIALAAFGVGLYFKRTPRETLQRLGVTRLTARHVLIALGLVAVAFAVAIASAELLKLLQPDIYNRVQDNTEALTSNINSVWGAALLGLTAGIGEELLFRGALQPRYGIIFTSIVFALLHVQYDASIVTVGIFAAGLIFGLERKYLNTSSSMITHAVYNTLAVILSL